MSDEKKFAAITVRIPQDKLSKFSEKCEAMYKTKTGVLLEAVDIFIETGRLADSGLQKLEQKVDNLSLILSATLSKLVDKEKL